jgi:Fe-S-cluster-containing dehydrogenase component/CRP-like cAMP-binding protein
MVDDLKSIKRPQRWDVPFWRELPQGYANEITTADLDRLLQTPLLRAMDQSRFAESAQLRDILLNDACLRRFKKGEIVVRQGDYGNSAFIILGGTLRVMLEALDASIIGRREPQHKSWFSAVAQLWRNPTQPEVRNLGRAGKVKSADGHGAIFVQDVSAIVKDKRSAELHAGDLFGEIAALSRTPRTTTVVADTDAELLEIRWQGLREIRLRSVEFKEYVDRVYRERSLKTHLREMPMFKHLDEAVLEKVAAATEFLSFGNYDWHSSFSKIRQSAAAERIQQEPIIASEGHYPNGVYMINSGFARLSEAYNHGERTVSYLGRGQYFGLREIVRNWKDKEHSVSFQQTLRAVGYTHTLFVPTTVMEDLVLPTLSAAELLALAGEGEFRKAGAAELIDSKSDAAAAIGSEMMEFIVERRLMNGTATMLIDLDRCTRCDDCVRACAAMHDNNPRFIRHGPVTNGLMVANACMHCLDPVCMIGCPTGAIHRESAHGRVVINDQTCIGCATCANSCPYDNIQMVFARDKDGIPYRDDATNQPIQKAAKCDLCSDQITGPACANACPHDALARVDMRDLDRLSKWLSKQ